MAEFAVPAPDEANPFEYLDRFLISLRQQLEEALQYERGLILDADFVGLLVAAYPPVPAALETMRGHVLRRQVDLEAHALRGPSLTLKLALIAAASVAFQAEYRAVLSSAAPRARPRRARGIFKKLLERIDILLESLAASLPGGVGGLVVEFKKAMEQAVPDDFGENR